MRYPSLIVRLHGVFDILPIIDAGAARNRVPVSPIDEAKTAIEALKAAGWLETKPDDLAPAGESLAVRVCWPEIVDAIHTALLANKPCRDPVLRGIAACIVATNQSIDDLAEWQGRNKSHLFVMTLTLLRFVAVAIQENPSEKPETRP